MKAFELRFRFETPPKLGVKFELQLTGSVLIEGREPQLYTSDILTSVGDLVFLTPFILTHRDTRDPKQVNISITAQDLLSGTNFGTYDFSLDRLLNSFDRILLADFPSDNLKRGLTPRGVTQSLTPRSVTQSLSRGLSGRKSAVPTLEIFGDYVQGNLTNHDRNYKLAKLNCNCTLEDATAFKKKSYKMEVHVYRAMERDRFLKVYDSGMRQVKNKDGILSMGDCSMSLADTTLLDPDRIIKYACFYWDGKQRRLFHLGKINSAALIQHSKVTDAWVTPSVNEEDAMALGLELEIVDLGNKARFHWENFVMF